MGKQWKHWQTLFWGAAKSLQMVTAAMKLKDAYRKKSYDQSGQHLQKQRHYFVNKGSPSQSYGFFLVVMYGCKGWTIKKTERWIIDAFKLWCCRRLPWTARRSNQSVLKEISPEYSFIHWKDWCWSSNTLATWCKELTHWKRLWCWERLKAGEGDDRGWDGWMALRTWWTWVWASSGSWWWTGKLGML